MKNEAIRNRNNEELTPYFFEEEMNLVPEIGEFSVSLHRMRDGEIAASFSLAAITEDFVYYLNEEETDENTCIVMLNREDKLVSDNYFASNDFFELLQKNEGLLWVSHDVAYSQRAAFVKPEKLTDSIKEMLERVDVDNLNPEEKKLFEAFLNNGPVKYSKAESLMAVLSGDLDPDERSQELEEVEDALKQESRGRKR